jgi:hypothetical protein
MAATVALLSVAGVMAAPPAGQTPAGWTTLFDGTSLKGWNRVGDAKRWLCSLYLSLMDRMGVELPSFGDADDRLAGI